LQTRITTQTTNTITTTTTRTTTKAIRHQTAKQQSVPETTPVPHQTESLKNAVPLNVACKLTCPVKQFVHKSP
jgi:hypothetical protein